MACVTADLSLARCNSNTLSSETMQRQVWLQFLCKIALRVNAAGGACGTANLLTAAEDLVCAGGGTARQRMIQAQTICESTLDIDCTPPVCIQPDVLEAMISILVCRIVNALEIV